MIVRVDEEVTVNRAGKRIRESDQVHLWSFDARGKIVHHRQRDRAPGALLMIRSPAPKRVQTDPAPVTTR